MRNKLILFNNQKENFLNYSFSFFLVSSVATSNNDVTYIYIISADEFVCLVGVCDTGCIGIDPIPSKYWASLADTDTFLPQMPWSLNTFAILPFVSGLWSILKHMTKIIDICFINKLQYKTI